MGKTISREATKRVFSFGGGFVDTLVKKAVVRAGVDLVLIPARAARKSMRAGFVTYAHLRGASDQAIAPLVRLAVRRGDAVAIVAV